MGRNFRYRIAIDKVKQIKEKITVLFFYSKLPFRIKYFFFKSKKPDSVNLALSVRCQARCIYCPENRGFKIMPKDMTFETAKKIIDELKMKNYKGQLS